MNGLVPTLSGTLVVVLTTMACGDQKGDTATARRPDLESIKSLVGDWVRVSEDGIPTDEVVSSIKITAGGSAVREVLFPDTDHEMITIYHQEGDDLVLTHYCVLGNQPHMRARHDTAPGTIVFQCVAGTRIACDKDSHMHQGAITWIGDDRIRTEWKQVEDGENSYTAAFELVRKKS